MLKVGLTGGIGSGKSTVSKFLIEKGYKVIDADTISREVLKLYPEINEAISLAFGDDFFDKNGELIRRKLGEAIFSDKEKKKNLESIILPFIKLQIFDRMDKLEKNGEKLCFLDAPTLIETGLNKVMDKNILVWASKESQINRVIKRDNLTNEEVISRINSQIDLNEKKKIVDFIIDNNNSLEETQNQVEALIKEIGRYK